MNHRGNRRAEVAAIRGLLAGAALDLEAVRLERTLRRKFSEDQPRAPAGQPDGGQWVSSGGGQGIGGRSDGDVAHREQTVLEDGTRVLSLRIRSGRRDYDTQDIVTAPDGQSRIFETSGLTQTIRDGETGAVLGRSTFTAAGAEPEAFAQPAFLPAAPVAVATVELALRFTQPDLGKTIRTAGPCWVYRLRNSCRTPKAPPHPRSGSGPSVSQRSMPPADATVRSRPSPTKLRAKFVPAGCIGQPNPMRIGFILKSTAMSSR